MKKIGIYGGTFSPPHRGHILAAETFFVKAGLDLLIVMPSNIPPHKAVAQDDNPQARLEMTKTAFGESKYNILVSDYELTLGGKSYTANTLSHYSEIYPEKDYELIFLCGTDMFLTLDKWYHPEIIFEKATIAYMRREDDRENDTLIAQKEAEYKKIFGAKIIKIEGSFIDISSSEIRRNIKDKAYAGKYLTDGVLEYIIKNGLYNN